MLNIIGLLQVFFMLLAGHALADYGLQSEWMQKNKRRDANPKEWYLVLYAHGLIHGLVVALIFQSPVLGFFESVAHSLIDFGKSENKYGALTDQILHILTKVLWIILMLYTNVH